MPARLLRKFRQFFTDKRFARKRDFLRSLELCRDLTNRELGHLLQSIHSRVYEEGEILFLEGDIGRALFILETGRIELSKRGADGSSKPLAVLEPGHFFGEMALLEQLPRSASAVAKERSSVFLLYRSKLDEILHYHPRIGVSIMTHLARILSARLRKTSQELSARPASNGSS